jgi:hypothetical protein
MSGEKHDPRQWYLRIGDKTVFGPVSTRGFVVWAEQGRILPGHEVSTDRKVWTPAEQVPELDISWYVDDGTGNLRGPLNRVAAEQILKSDKAPAGARLVEAKDADLTRVMRPAEPAPLPEPPPAAPSRKESSTRAHGEGAADPARLIEERDARIARLKQTVERLERDLADARNLPLLGVTPETPMPTPAAPPAKVTEELTALQRSLDAAGESARKERVARERAEADCAKQLAARDKELARLKTAEAESAKQLAARDQEIAQLKTAEAELLAFANARDAELRARVAELEAQAAAGRDTPTQAPAPDDLLRHVLTEELETLDKDLARERDSFNAFRDLSAQRQEALQARMQELARLQRGDATAPGSRIVRDSARTFETNRLKAELEVLRSTHERETRQAAERENELLRRVRVLETEEARMRGQFGESDKMIHQLDDLTDTLRRREQDLGLEQKHRTAEREQYQMTEQALLRRIEELERSGGAPMPAGQAGQAGDDSPHPPNSPFFRIRPWMRLRK